MCRFTAGAASSWSQCPAGTVASARAGQAERIASSAVGPLRPATAGGSEGSVLSRNRYDPGMSSLSRELRDLIESGPMAHLSTINPDGSPQVTVIWIGLDGDQPVSAHMARHVKLRNIERDPRVVPVLRRAAGAWRRLESIRRAARTRRRPAERRRMGFAQPSGEGLRLPRRRVSATQASRLYRALFGRACGRHWPLGAEFLAVRLLKLGPIADIARQRRPADGRDPCTTYHGCRTPICLSHPGMARTGAVKRRCVTAQLHFNYGIYRTIVAKRRRFVWQDSTHVYLRVPQDAGPRP